MVRIKQHPLEFTAHINRIHKHKRATRCTKALTYVGSGKESQHSVLESINIHIEKFNLTQKKSSRNKLTNTLQFSHYLTITQTATETIHNV